MSGVKQRAVSLDLARGFMLLLITLAHAPLYLYGAEPGMLQRVAGASFFDQIVNLFGILLIDNRARAMFAVLLGYGIVLAFQSQISRGFSGKEALAILRRRSWVLILFGIALAVLIGGQDIFMAYGIAILLVGWLLPRSNRALIRTFIIVTACYAVVIPILWGFNMQDIGSYSFPPEFAATDTYLSYTLERLFTFPITPVLIHLMFPVLPPVLLGMWIAKFRLLTNPELRLKTLYFIASIGLSVSLAGALPLTFVGTGWQPPLFTVGILYGIHILTGFAGGLAYAALFGIIGAKLTQPGRYTFTLTALGKRSLTFYVWNEAILVLLLSPVALDLGGRTSNGTATLIALGVWGLSVLLAAMMEKRNRNGPLEVLLRRLVYRRS
ncbi:glyoxalase [Paenibacillus swuensis]|uniref:Glyoxalase n=1 Tax=Paenibacillus swuensis TaxID=1178515 RepID=A0A172TFZ2_9BACL|nr:DUF418 domain-containing protein [Paenibacillus swuensis]ANE45930.1 glyoxalase [Paenibacillus swuensis]